MDITDVTRLLRHMVEVGASDLHLKAGNVPFVRVDGDLDPIAFPAMSGADTGRRPSPSCPSTSGASSSRAARRTSVTRWPGSAGS